MMIEIILFDGYTKCMNGLEEPLIPEMISAYEAASSWNITERQVSAFSGDFS